MQLKQDQMTSGERLKAIFSGEPVDRVPFHAQAIGFNAINVGEKIADFYRDPVIGVRAATRTIDQYNWERIPQLCLAPLGAVAFGGEVRWPSGEYSQAPQIVRHPVQTEDDVMRLEMPDVQTAGLVPILREFARNSIEAGHPYCLIGTDELFICASNLCSIDMLCKWVIRKPEITHRLMRFVTDFKLQIAEHLAEELDTDRIIPWLGEPTTENRLISPKTFEEFALPYTKEYHEKLIEMGYKIIATHICGEQNKNYPLWVQVHMGEPGIISVSQEVDLEKAIEYFPNEVIMGNIPPTLIQSGTPDEVYEAAKVCIEKGKKAPGGFILAPGCELPPKAPPYNVWIIMKAIDDFGWYS
jgi:uroporphyrinogen decarboxylase